METIKAISRRKSVRAYKTEQIPKEVLKTIVQAGFKAPVASGKYDSLHITVVQDKEILKRIAEAASDVVYQTIHIRKNVDFGAPTLILVSSIPTIMPGLEYANAACVLENMVLAATDQEIDSIIWGGAAVAVEKSVELKELLKIPAGYKTLLCASFGYAKEYEEPKEHTISTNMT